MKNYILLGLALLSAHLSFAQNNRGGAEVFIEIADRGNFTVYVDNEFIGSSTGRFRFYDVSNNTPTVSILQGTKKIFSGRVDVKNNERNIFNFSLRAGLSLAKNLTIYRNGQYALDDFGNYAGAYNTGVVPPRPTRGSSNFEELLTVIKREPFDDNKIKLIQIYSTNSLLSTAQTSVLLKTFSNDDKKLNLAQSLFPAISDVANYYTLADAFTFSSTKDKFLNYLNANSSPKRGNGMRASDFEELKNRVSKTPFDDDKTKLIQAAIQYASPSSAQIIELLKTYSFDEKALEIAKLASRSISDKGNYYTVKDAFRFKSTQDAFLDFLARK